MISSSSTRSASVGSQRSAAALARTWSPLVTPEMTEATAGWAASPAMATSSTLRPRSAAYFSMASIARPVDGADHQAGVAQGR